MPAGVESFVVAATSDRSDRAERLLATQPELDHDQQEVLGLAALDGQLLETSPTQREGIGMSTYAAARLEDIGEQSDGRIPYRPIRHHFGIRSFGVNAFVGREAGERIINEHDEDEPEAQEELYLVLTGHAEFELDGERLDAPAHTFVHAPAGVKRTAFARDPGTTILVLGGTPGKAYEPSGWEVWGPLRPLYDAGEYAEAADRGQELLVGNPSYRAVLQRRVLRSARRAEGRRDHASPPRIELADATREYAAEDSDLDSLREDPAFTALLAASA